jgi:anti-anti-sigma factor
MVPANGRTRKLTTMAERLTMHGTGRATHAGCSAPPCPRLGVRSQDGTQVADILGAETLFDGDDIARLGAQLRGLADTGTDRLVVDVSGVRAMSSDMFGVLAALSLRIGPMRGRVCLRGVDPVMLDMLRICRLARVLDVEGCGPGPP